MQTEAQTPAPPTPVVAAPSAPAPTPKADKGAKAGKTVKAAQPVAKPAAKGAAKQAEGVASKPARRPAAPAVTQGEKAEKAAKPAKDPARTEPKAKLVRDSFTMPQADFALIAQLKDCALGFQRPTKKSELLRAGLQALAALNDEVLKAVLAQLPEIKTGRPRKGH